MLQCRRLGICHKVPHKVFLLCCARKLTHFPLLLLYPSALVILMRGKMVPSSVGFSVTINGDTTELCLKPLQVRQQEDGGEDERGVGVGVGVVGLGDGLGGL